MGTRTPVRLKQSHPLVGTDRSLGSGRCPPLDARSGWGRTRPWVLLLAAVLPLLLSFGPTVSVAATTQLAGKWGFGVRSGLVPDLSSHTSPLRLSGAWERARGRGGSPAVRFGGTSIAVGSDNARLDPGRRKFAVAIVFRVKDGMRIFEGTDTPNLVQKGRYNSRGQWKLQLTNRDGGRVQCRVKGEAGSTLITSNVARVVSDERWHKAICVRRHDQVALIVDGKRVSRNVRVGQVDSDARMTVANKSSSSRSDQFRGVIDALAIARGEAALERARSATRR